MPGLLRQYALLSFPTGLYAHLQGSDLAENGLDGVECTAHHPGSLGVARYYVHHNTPVEYKRPGTCYFPSEQGQLRMNNHHTN